MGPSVSPMMISKDKSNKKDSTMTLQDRVNSIQESIREATSKDKLILFQESIKKKQEAIREVTSKHNLISFKESIQKKTSPVLFKNHHDLTSSVNRDPTTTNTTSNNKSKMTMSIMNNCRRHNTS